MKSLNSIMRRLTASRLRFSVVITVFIVGYTILVYSALILGKNHPNISTLLSLVALVGIPILMGALVAYKIDPSTFESTIKNRLL